MTDKLDSMAPKIVYDVDDVLWSLFQADLNYIGYSRDRDIDYHYADDPRLSDAEKSAITEAFHLSEVFTKMDFYPETQEILRPEFLGAEVYINSNCFSEEIIEHKRRQLAEILPNLPPERIALNLVTIQTNRKTIPAEVFAFVDDSPYNIAKSSAKLNIVPEISWTYAQKTRDIMCQDKTLLNDWSRQLPAASRDFSEASYVVIARDLAEVNQIVYQAVKFKQEAQNATK